MSVWPIPENSTDVLKVEVFSELTDVNKSADQNADVPKRFLPCLTAGLSYYMSMKRFGVDAESYTNAERQTMKSVLPEQCRKIEKELQCVLCQD